MACTHPSGRSNRSAKGRKPKFKLRNCRWVHHRYDGQWKWGTDDGKPTHGTGRTFCLHALPPDPPLVTGGRPHLIPHSEPPSHHRRRRWFEWFARPPLEYTATAPRRRNRCHDRGPSPVRCLPRSDPSTLTITVPVAKTPACLWPRPFIEPAATAVYFALDMSRVRDLPEGNPLLERESIRPY